MDETAPPASRQQTDPVTVCRRVGDVAYVATYAAAGPGSARLTELRATADAGAAPLTAEILRAAPLGELQKAANAALRAQSRDWAGSSAWTSLPARFSAPEDYRRLLALHRRLQEAGDPAPVRTIAETTGVSAHTVAARLKTARRQAG